MSDYLSIIVTIATFVIGAFGALCWRYLADIKQSMKEKDECQDKALEGIRSEIREAIRDQGAKIEIVAQDLNRFKIAVARDYAQREEVVRTMQGFDNKLDRVCEAVSDIKIDIAKLVTAKEAHNAQH